MKYLTKICHKTLTFVKLILYNRHEFKRRIKNLMKKEEKIWAKTLLSTYSYLETICGAIDKTVLNYGIHSALNNDAEFVAKKIISLIERKKFLINTKILVDNVLSRINQKNARVLVLKYIDKLKAEKASFALNISLRTYFRRINFAVDEFAFELLKFGYTPQKLLNIFEKESWIMEIYSSFEKKDMKESELDSFNFLGLALKSFKKKSFQVF